MITPVLKVSSLGLLNRTKNVGFFGNSTFRNALGVLVMLK